MRILHFILKILGAIIVAYSIYYISNQKNDLKLFNYFEINGETLYGVLSLPSAFFILFTLSGLSLLLFSISDILFALRTFFVSNDTLNIQLRRVKKNMKKMCESYYQDGVDGVTKVINFNKLPNSWKLAMKHLQMKLPIEDIESLIEFNKYLYDKKMSHAVNICSILSSFAPSIGIMGTVVGLIQLLADLKDPSTIGPNMSVAMMTTLYGIIMGSVILSPITRKFINTKKNSIEIYENLEFWLEIVREKKPSFYSEQDYQKKTKK